MKQLLKDENKRSILVTVYGVGKIDKLSSF